MIMAMAALMVLGMSACSSTMDEATGPVETTSVTTAANKTDQDEKTDVGQKTLPSDNAAEKVDRLEGDEEKDEAAELPRINAGETATGKVSM